MNSVRPKPAAEINLEEFERRLRAAAAPQAGVEDPLAELTRLVDTINFDRTPSERALEATRAPKLTVPPPAPSPAKPPPLPGAGTPPPAPPLDPPNVEGAAFDDSSAQLRMAFDDEEDGSAFKPPSAARPETSGPVIATPTQERRRGANWSLKVGGLVIASVAMIGAVVAYKVAGRSHSGAPPLILASQAPTKVAPPSEETVRTANESGSLLTRDTAQPTPTQPKLVAPAEAPVDLSAQGPGSATADASPVAPAGNTPIVAQPSTAAAPAAPVGTDPSRVKTISVRPDGTLISSSYEANAAAAPPPAPAPAPTKPAAVDGEATTPAPALPTKLSPPKSSARVVAKTDTTAPAEGAAGPGPVKPKKPKPTPTPSPAVAEAEPKTDAGDDASGYSVQFGAPRNQADADTLLKALPGRYGEAIGSTQLAVRKADRDGQTVYRVRTVNMSRADAKAMCVKIKSAGGDCFVAKN